jgi:hypothetical protein
VANAKFCKGSKMTQITKASVAWDGILANIYRLIDDWNPEEFEREREYRDSLAAYLRECAPSARIECEYRHLGTTIDIYVELDGFLGTHRVLIELKRNLTVKAEYNRLVGQIEDMVPAKHNIVIALCGDTSAGLFDRLKATYKTSVYPEPNVAIVCKKSNPSK